MKKIQKYRLGVQLLCLVLTVVAFFANFKVAMLVILGFIPLGGTFYCGWICPYGFIQDLFSKLGRLLGVKKRKMPRHLHKILVFSRYIILVLFILITTDLIFSIFSFDPRANFQSLLLGKSVAIGAIIVMVFFALVALFFDRPFCNYLCYEGAKYGLMSSMRLFTIKRDDSTCVNCKKCDKVCPMNIEVSKCSNLRSPHCINCFQCVSSCPKAGTLSYGKCNMNKIEKKKYFAMIIALLILISTLKVYNNSNETTAITIEDTENLGDAAGINDGVYIGEGLGFNGIITVQVGVKTQQIVSIEVIDHIDDKKFFDRAIAVIPDKITQSQSTDVSVVSGATYSSIGIRDGVKDALEKAKKK